MSIVLNGVTLNPNMIWEDRYSFSPVSQNVQVTLSGTIVVQSGTLQKGRPITLVAAQDQGWLTKEQLDLVVAMSDFSGGVYTLTIGAETFNVMFRHQEAPAIEFTPLIPRAVPQEGDYFVGSIKLMTV